MYMIHCYSQTVSIKKYQTMPDSDIINGCEYEYGVEVTPETYFAIEANKPYSKNVAHGVKIFYFTKAVTYED